jgi:hypothetical protein
MQTLKKFQNLAAKLILIASLLAGLGLFAAPALAATSTTSSSGACKDTTNASGTVSSAAVEKCLDQSPIVHDLQTIVNFLAGAVGIVVIGAIMFGGIQYTMAGDNPSATSAAKKRITDALLALLVFIFTYAFLQWIIPGGIFS